MSQESSLKPGESQIFSCPDNAKHGVTQAQLYPKAEPSVWIVPKTPQELIISPLRYGTHQIEVLCTPGTSQKIVINLMANESAKQIPPDPPLGLLQPQIPIGFFVLWFLALLAISFLSLRLYRNFTKDKNSDGSQTNIYVDPEADYKAWLRLLSDLRLNSQDRSKMTQEISPRFRKFLEYKLQFAADWATTPEFLGALKSALIGQNLEDSFYHDLERGLYQLDAIRFSKQKVEDQEFESILQNFSKLTQLIEKSFPEKAKDSL